MLIPRRHRKEGSQRENFIKAALAAAALNSDDIDVANSESRSLVALLEDTSDSTLYSGAIQEIVKGLRCLVDILKRDPITRNSVELLVASFPDIINRPNATKGFHSPANIGPLDLPGGGGTPGAQAVLFAANACIQRVGQLDKCGISQANVPLVLLLTDGQFGDTHFFAQAAKVVRQLEEERSVFFASFYTEGADLSILRTIFRFPPVPISNLNTFFSSLGRSLRTLSLGKLDHLNADPRGVILREIRDEHGE